jgi:parvulin-like peptidyl-prolyl isomerase
MQKMYLRAKVIEKKFPDTAQVTDQEVKEYYDKNRESKYSKPAMVKASHILIDTRGKNEQEKAEAKKQAETLLADAKKPNADFAALARANSADPTAKNNGGDVGFFPRSGAMEEPFAAAAFALKKDEISDLVETQYGYHIIKLTDRKEPTTRPFDDAAAGIREALQREKVGAQMQKYAEELRKSAKIVYPKGKEPASQPAPRMTPGTRPAMRVR